MSDADGSPSDNWFHRMRRGEAPRAAVSDLLGEAILYVDVAQGQLRVQFQAAPSFCNPAGGVQGGMLAAMLDAITAGLVDATLLPGQVPVTLSLHTQYLRPARVGELLGEAHFTRRGREVCFVHGQLLQAGQPVATAQATVKIMTPSARADAHATTGPKP
jgi:uncharacterized protein (TIGR00369 family)